MTDVTTILVTFHVREGQRAAFLAGLGDLCETMSKEPSFINSFVTEDLDNPTILYNYETWAETRESFLSTQFNKSYRESYEAQVETWLSDRTITWLSGPLLHFETDDATRWGEDRG